VTTFSVPASDTSVPLDTVSRGESPLPPPLSPAYSIPQLLVDARKSVPPVLDASLPPNAVGRTGSPPSRLPPPQPRRASPLLASRPSLQARRLLEARRKIRELEAANRQLAASLAVSQQQVAVLAAMNQQTSAFAIDLARHFIFRPGGSGTFDVSATPGSSTAARPAHPNLTFFYIDI
jgi:hypothetical protein